MKMQFEPPILRNHNKPFKYNMIYISIFLQTLKNWVSWAQGAHFRGFSAKNGPLGPRNPIFFSLNSKNQNSVHEILQRILWGTCILNLRVIEAFSTDQIHFPWKIEYQKNDARYAQNGRFLAKNRPIFKIFQNSFRN